MVREQQVPGAEVVLQLASGRPHGPPILLLHGVLRRWYDFFPLLPALETRWQYFGLDFRGHGQSAHVANGYRVADYTRDVVEVLAKEFSEPVVIYGHSLGAMVAAQSASLVPDRVRALILEDPPFQTMGQRIRETAFHSQFVGIQAAIASQASLGELTRRLADIRISIPGSATVTRLGDVRDCASLRFSAQCLLRVDPNVLPPIVDGTWLEGYDLNQVASSLRCPALVLQADPQAGGMLTDEDARTLSSAHDDCWHVPFPGVGHLIHWTAPDATLRVVGNFLESLR